MYADRAECPGRFVGTVRQYKFGLGEHNVTDNLSIFLHHEIQFWNESWVVAILVQNVMLLTSGAIYIPKGLSR
jgi:hypothetical protein